MSDWNPLVLYPEDARAGELHYWCDLTLLDLFALAAVQSGRVANARDCYPFAGECLNERKKYLESLEKK